MVRNFLIMVIGLGNHSMQNFLALGLTDCVFGDSALLIKGYRDMTGLFLIILLSNKGVCSLIGLMCCYEGISWFWCLLVRGFKECLHISKYEGSEVDITSYSGLEILNQQLHHVSLYWLIDSAIIYQLVGIVWCRKLYGFSLFSFSSLVWSRPQRLEALNIQLIMQIML